MVFRDIKIVRDKKTGTISMAMHMEKTFRACLLCIVLPTHNLAPNAASDRSWTWVTTDFADFNEPGVAKIESFAVKFKTPESMFIYIYIYIYIYVLCPLIQLSQ